jgi:hypothetical protein
MSNLEFAWFLICTCFNLPMQPFVHQFGTRAIHSHNPTFGTKQNKNLCGSFKNNREQTKLWSIEAVASKQIPKFELQITKLRYPSWRRYKHSTLIPKINPTSRTSRSSENSRFPYVFHRLVVSCKFRSISFTKFVRQIWTTSLHDIFT